MIQDDEVKAEKEEQEPVETPEEEGAEATEETSKEPKERTPEEEIAHWRDIATRSVAELENYRKRMAKEKSEAIVFANQRLLEDLFPVIDNFNMGMMAAANDADSMIFKGMEMVQGQLAGFLEAQNVTTVSTKAGDDFDPNLHEAMSKENSADVEDGKIVRAIRNGYQIGNRLVRPASVVVCAKEDA